MFDNTAVNVTVSGGQSFTEVVQGHSFVGWMLFVAICLSVLLLFLGVVFILRRLYVDFKHPAAAAVCTAPAAARRRRRVVDVDDDGQGREGYTEEVEGEGEERSPPPSYDEDDRTGSPVTDFIMPNVVVRGDEEVEAMIAGVMPGNRRATSESVTAVATAAVQSDTRETVAAPTIAATPASTAPADTLRAELKGGWQALYAWAVQFGLCGRLLISAMLVCLIIIYVVGWFMPLIPIGPIFTWLGQVSPTWASGHEIWAHINALVSYGQFIKDNTNVILGVVVSWLYFVRGQPLR